MQACVTCSKDSEHFDKSTEILTRPRKCADNRKELSNSYGYQKILNIVLFPKQAFQSIDLHITLSSRDFC